eukprot:scaffold241_cov113-Skeletonema_menzelii.AAC.4
MGASNMGCILEVHDFIGTNLPLFPREREKIQGPTANYPPTRLIHPRNYSLAKIFIPTSSGFNYLVGAGVKTQVIPN